MGDLALTTTRLAGPPHDRDLLVVGPSLGTSVVALWGACASRLGDRCEVVGWDLPGHGTGSPTMSPFAVADLAASVRRFLADAGERQHVWYAGVSIGGAVGLELALDPGPVEAVAVIASSAKIGTTETWTQRAELARSGGTQAVIEGSIQRWFAPGYYESHPEIAGPLVRALDDADDESYALACGALERHDLRADLGRAQVPILYAPGEHDAVVPPVQVARDADASAHATFRVLEGCAHLPPAEDPSAVASMLADFFSTAVIR